MFHLGWFLGAGFGIQPWNTQAWDGTFNGTNATDWMKPDLYVDLCTSLERAGFDFLFIEDTLMVEDSYQDSMRFTLKTGRMAPKNDPIPLVPIMAQATSHIGIIPTISTVGYHPYLAARLMTTLDHLTDGRVGVNIVTSVTDRVAQNFGYDTHLEHDLRYEMAGEWMDVVRQLWDSWEPGAVVLDEVGRTYADHTKVHPIDFVGKFYRSRGPLNTIPGPQRHPVIAQAGNSPPGRDLAARHADTMLAHATSVEAMKELREDMHQRLIGYGRSPDEFKIVFLVSPTVAETDAAAAERDRVAMAHATDAEAMEGRLWGLTYVSGGRVDFGSLDLDAPIPDVIGNGEQSSLAAFAARNVGKTLREAVATPQPQGHNLGLSGSPDTVAAKMDEIMAEVGGDGYLVYLPMTRRTIAEITDGLCPALRRRGLIRDGYEFPTFRENLHAF